MVFRSRILAIIVVAALFGGIAVSAMIGYWQTEASKTPAKFESGEFAGEYNPADIRGSYTFEDIERTFGVPIEVMARAYGFADADQPGAIQPKLFEELFEVTGDLEVGTDSVRLFVSLYTDRPYTPEETTGLPYPALSILKQEGKIDQEKFEEMRDTIGVDLETLFGENAPDETAAAENAQTEDEERLVKGKTSFREVMDWGVSSGEIEEVLGMEMGTPTMSVRDYWSEKEVEFAAVKTGLQELVDRVSE